MDSNEEEVIVVECIGQISGWDSSPEEGKQAEESEKGLAKRVDEDGGGDGGSVAPRVDSSPAVAEVKNETKGGGSAGGGRSRWVNTRCEGEASAGTRSRKRSRSWPWSWSWAWPWSRWRQMEECLGTPGGVR